MKRLAIVSLVAFAVFAAGSAGASTPKLSGFVNDSFKIGVTKGGKTVSSLKAGMYVLVVADTTSNHNFHIKGPGVDKATSVGGKGTTRWTLRLRKGTYTYVCDPHSSFMKGSFTVR